MGDSIIRVENLSKRYTLTHQEQPRHFTLRDVLTDKFSAITRSFQHRDKAKQSKVEEFWALKDVSFEIQQGDRVGIIGRNGAGKSTLLKILSRITEPTSGNIRLKGRVASLLEVGTGFHPELTGRENIFLNGAILGMSKAEIKHKFDEIVAFAEVEKFIDTPVKRYSSGMYVRLAFAVAAHLEPEILIVDEVLAVGDLQFQRKCLGKMSEVANQGRTILFVSHNMGAISTLCNQAIYLANGQVREIGISEKVVKSYFMDILHSQTRRLEELRLPGYGEEARFICIELLSDSSSLAFNEVVKYRLVIQSKSNLRGLSIGSSFFNSEGTCIGTLITEDIELEPHKENVFELAVSNINLSPGSYYAGFSIGFGQTEGTRKDLDIVVGEPNFEIMPIDKESKTINWHQNWGSVVFNNTEISKLA